MATALERTRSADPMEMIALHRLHPQNAAWMLAAE